MGARAGNLHWQIAEIAARQHGVVSREQLLGAGVSRRAIARRLDSGLLIVEFRGVYRVGHAAPSALARYMAATLACGDGALLCGRAAAHLFQLIRTPPPSPEVVTPVKRCVPGIITHRAATRPGTRWRTIPTTTIPRTLIDLAAVLPPDALARACHEAQVKYGTTPRQVERILPRTAPGKAALKAVLRGDEPVTLSALERRFLQLLRDNHLPLPHTNRKTGAHYVDCRWPDHHLTAELDSYRYHHTRHAWEQDRHREREAHARGDDFRRYTYEDVHNRPQPMLAELRALLAAA